MRLLQLQMAAQSHLGEQPTALHGTSLYNFSLLGQKAKFAISRYLKPVSRGILLACNFPSCLLAFFPVLSMLILMILPFSLDKAFRH